MSNVQLAFSPSADWAERRETLAAATAMTSPFTVTVPKNLFHRRIYIWHSRTTFQLVGRIFARIGGQIVFSMPYVMGSSSGNNTLQIGNLGTSAPNTIDMIKVGINGTSAVLIPYNIILACDTIGLEFSQTFTAGTAGQFLGVLSQNYW